MTRFETGIQGFKRWSQYIFKIDCDKELAQIKLIQIYNFTCISPLFLGQSNKFFREKMQKYFEDGGLAAVFAMESAKDVQHLITTSPTPLISTLRFSPPQLLVQEKSKADF